jgi:hypothetical protein
LIISLIALFCSLPISTAPSPTDKFTNLKNV